MRTHQYLLAVLADICVLSGPLAHTIRLPGREKIGTREIWNGKITLKTLLDQAHPQPSRSMPCTRTTHRVVGGLRLMSRPM